ncbi:MAG TPA: hypothetical protein PLN69_10270 [bacterium]|nr:hypothetical protein [bacterium]
MFSKKKMILAVSTIFTILLVVNINADCSKSEPDPYDQIDAIHVVDAIHTRFMAHDIKTMTYDETRVMASEDIRKSAESSRMALNPSNATAMKMRNFYQAPNKHGYKMLSEQIKNYWQGSPNQAGAIPMDAEWKDKIYNWYDLYRAPDQEYRNINCIVILLKPKSDAPDNLYNMTWYIDPDKYIVLMFRYLIKGEKQENISATGEMYYEQINDMWLPVRADWRTRVSKLPFVFTQTVEIDNYHFNIPLDESVFEEQFPDRWFENMGQQPPVPNTK